MPGFFEHGLDGFLADVELLGDFLARPPSGEGRLRLH
jgi:hypothetical protein